MYIVDNYSYIHSLISEETMRPCPPPKYCIDLLAHCLQLD